MKNKLTPYRPNVIPKPDPVVARLFDFIDGYKCDNLYRGIHAFEKWTKIIEDGRQNKSDH